MRRIELVPREDWRQKVTSAGLVFHSPEGMDRPYWDESASYAFESAEIDRLEAAGNRLQEMCLAAAQHIIDRRRYAELAIPEVAIPAIEWAWENEPPALYGRFDVAYDGEGPPKLLEYNADTPTSLLEAAVIQWTWLEERYPKEDQFNSIHEKLIAKWKDVAPYLSKPVYFAGVEDNEDQLTLAYLADTAQQAGVPTRAILMEEIGWNDARQAFVDLDEQQMFSVFKLYPWEMMLNEEFGAAALETYTSIRWIEPIWKMLFSNKGLLPVLWELFPGDELLLEAHFEASAPAGWSDYVRKPLNSREGSNITIVRNGVEVAATEGPYDGPAVVQAIAPIASFPDNLRAGEKRHPVLGLWMVDQECCGMGIRESSGLITGNLSSFVPHFFKD
jgi:glutathionylspermidine synthase